MIVNLCDKKSSSLSDVYELGLAYAIGYDDGGGAIELVDAGPFTCFRMANRYMKDKCSKDPILIGSSLFIVGLNVRKV